MRVTLNGIVSSDDDVEVYNWWGYQAFSPKTIREAIKSNPQGEELVFEINSPGGSVYAGSEMYSVIRSAGIQSRAEIQSLAASAASYLCLGCNTVMISPVAQMMVHLPSTSTHGNRYDHLESVQMLDTTRESILNAYELKAHGKANRAEFRRLMQSSTFLTAQQAVELGLADGILYQDDPDPTTVVNAVGAGIRALGESGCALDIVSMRAEYHKAHQGAPDGCKIPGAVPEGENEDWRVKARLDLEKLRMI